MSWNSIATAFKNLSAAARRGEDPRPAWDRFKAEVEASRDEPPYHLRLILETLEEVRKDRPRSEVQILDHGCGTGRTTLYLLALGFRNVWGVALNDECEVFNPLLSSLGLAGQRFAATDGISLPFQDSVFDFVFSQQVLEHVRPEALEAFYKEERRVMKPGAAAYHQVPHRLTPFDSHTRTWLIHYLPRRIWVWLLHFVYRGKATPEGNLFLRWPWVHRRLARRYFGNYEDMTMTRFAGLSDLSYYEGPRRLRRTLGIFLGMPIIGPLGRCILPHFVMLDTVSKIPSADSGASSPN